MNKYQEALDRFKVVAQNDWVNNYQKCKDEEKTIHIGNYRMFEIDGEAIKTLQELVDKETPKELISVYDDTVYSSNQTTLFKIYKCPVCGNKNITPDNKYCRECGNRVFRKRKWSEE